nr:hypothetical protein [Tanacetum cinerariifolium]
MRTNIQQIDTTYSNQLNMTYQSPETVAIVIFHIRFLVLFYVFSSMRAHPSDHLLLFAGNSLMKARRRIAMVEPIMEDYIYVSQKNFLSGDNEGRVVKKSFLEIQGTFLVKIRDNTLNGTIRENTVGHIENFLKVVGPLKIKGVSQDRFRLSVFPISLLGATSEWFKKECIVSITT